MSEYPEFSAESVRDGYWEIYHDDSCGVTLVDGRCPVCGFVPDMQSLGARRTNKPVEKLERERQGSQGEKFTR